MANRNNMNIVGSSNANQGWLEGRQLQGARHVYGNALAAGQGRGYGSGFGLGMFQSSPTVKPKSAAIDAMGKSTRGLVPGNNGKWGRPADRAPFRQHVWGGSKIGGRYWNARGTYHDPDRFNVGNVNPITGKGRKPDAPTFIPNLADPPGSNPPAGGPPYQPPDNSHGPSPVRPEPVKPTPPVNSHGPSPVKPNVPKPQKPAPVKRPNGRPSPIRTTPAKPAKPKPAATGKPSNKLPSTSWKKGSKIPDSRGRVFEIIGGAVKNGKYVPIVRQPGGKGTMVHPSWQRSS